MGRKNENSMISFFFSHIKKNLFYLICPILNKFRFLIPALNTGNLRSPYFFSFLLCPSVIGLNAESRKMRSQHDTDRFFYSIFMHLFHGLFNKRLNML